MRHDEVGEALDYLYWVRDRILAASARLTDEQFRREETVTTRSLRATLVHQLECEWAWRIRLAEGTFPEDGLHPEAFDSLGALVARWRHEEAALRGWYGGLSDSDLARVPPGDPPSSLTAWRHLLYLVNHGTQQFSEAAVLLTRLGQSPGEIGYLEFCRRGNAAAPLGSPK